MVVLTKHFSLIYYLDWQSPENEVDGKLNQKVYRNGKLNHIRFNIQGTVLGMLGQ